MGLLKDKSEVKLEFFNSTLFVKVTVQHHQTKLLRSNWKSILSNYQNDQFPLDLNTLYSPIHGFNQVKLLLFSSPKYKLPSSISAFYRLGEYYAFLNSKKS